MKNWMDVDDVLIDIWSTWARFPLDRSSSEYFIACTLFCSSLTFDALFDGPYRQWTMTLVLPSSQSHPSPSSSKSRDLDRVHTNPIFAAVFLCVLRPSMASRTTVFHQKSFERVIVFLWLILIYAGKLRHPSNPSAFSGFGLRRSHSEIVAQ